MKFRPYSALLLVGAALSSMAPLRGDSAPASAPAPASVPAGVPSAAALPYDDKADAPRDLAAALKTAKRDGRLVLLDFGANWCPDCRALGALFNDPKVKPFLDAHYILVPIDVGRWNKNMELSKQYGEPTQAGIPAVVILGGDGRQHASTGDGALANARTATPEQVLALLQRWATPAPSSAPAP